jgi:hypothetical protein
MSAWTYRSIASKTMKERTRRQGNDSFCSTEGGPLTLALVVTMSCIPIKSAILKTAFAHNLQRAVAQSVTLVARILKMTGSNLGWNLGYSDRGVPWLSLVPPADCRDSASSSMTTVSFQILSHPLSTRRRTIRECHT